VATERNRASRPLLGGVSTATSGWEGQLVFPDVDCELGVAELLAGTRDWLADASLTLQKAAHRI
jgi:hypothetical protein